MSDSKTLNRLDWVDIAKGLGILCVIIGHFPDNFVLKWVYTFHLPLFFMISGYLFNASKYEPADFVKRKAKAILLPYLGMGIIINLINWCFYDFGNPVAFANYFWQLAMQKRYHTLWYLSVLFLSVLLFYFLVRITKDSKLWLSIITVALSVLGLIYYANNGSELPWNIDAVPFATLFLCIGYLGKSLELKRDWWLGGLALAINIGLAILNYVLTGDELEMFNCKYNIPPITLICAIAGVYAIFVFSSKIHSKVLTYIGKNSMFYFGLHQAVAIPAWEMICYGNGWFANFETQPLVMLAYVGLGTLFTLVVMTFLHWIFAKLPHHAFFGA